MLLKLGTVGVQVGFEPLTQRILAVLLRLLGQARNEGLTHGAVDVMHPVHPGVRDATGCGGDSTRIGEGLPEDEIRSPIPGEIDEVLDHGIVVEGEGHRDRYLVSQQRGLPVLGCVLRPGPVGEFVLEAVTLVGGHRQQLGG